MKPNARLSDALGTICVFLIFAGCVEGMNGELTWWTVLCLGLAAIFGWLSKKTTPKPTPKTGKK